MDDLSNRFHRVSERVVAACVASDRDPSEVTLVAVSKGSPVSAIESLYSLGHRDFGENRAQELRDKVPDLPDDIRWHFVGPLQSNKARTVRPAVCALHSFDRIDLAPAWMKGAGRPPATLLQVNIGGEEQKSGVAPELAAESADELMRMGIPLVGIMAIPPLSSDPEDSRRYFANMRSIRDVINTSHAGVKELSMGMSDDFEVAISEGSTAIRVGRAIFQD